jgi:hypothetical protein
MKNLKIMGLAVVAAMAFMALVGASTASATALYNGATKLAVGSELSASLKTGTSANLTTTEGTVLNTCTGSSLSGKVTNAGGAAATVVGSVEAKNLTWSGCSNTVATLGGGELEVHYTSGLNGTLTAKGFKVTVDGPFGSCVFTAGAATNMGTLTGSTTGNATMDVNAVVTRESGLCPSSARWVATYTVTKPSPLHVTAS